MTDDIEWGPWIEHDGKAPVGPEGQKIRPGMKIIERFEGEGRRRSPYEDSASGRDINSPCWFWSWKRKSWFSTKRVRVCDDPEYAPIIRYRWGKPRAKSAAAERLAEIVNLKAKPVGKEGPTRAPKETAND